uniref:Heat shock protein 20-3 n=1 Tax=Tytthus chinensis TaxID=981288 RepID=A0A346THP3_9HEMI|nr:heat shock protein 20-3 [Tytthus chinensis]
MSTGGSSVNRRKMALLPLLVNEILDEVRRPPLALSDLYDQHFGLGIDDIITTRNLLPSVGNVCVPALRAGYLRPWRQLAHSESGVSTVKNNDKEFSVKLDVNHFKPEELKVKIGDDGFVVVEGEHEERTDQHGFVSRHFKRRYKLPEDAMPDTLKSSLSSDGVLSLTAAKKPVKRKAEREIEIVRTNEPAIKKAEQVEVDSKKKRVEQNCG